MISLDLMISSEVRIAGDRSTYCFVFVGIHTIILRRLCPICSHKFVCFFVRIFVFWSCDCSLNLSTEYLFALEILLNNTLTVTCQFMSKSFVNNVYWYVLLPIWLFCLFQPNNVGIMGRYVGNDTEFTCKHYCGVQCTTLLAKR